MLNVAVFAAVAAMGFQPAAKEQEVEKGREKLGEVGGSGAGTVVAFPHPLITEILYDVPRGGAGDADQDGKREATGDEFIELVNPHGKAINLKGYVLADSTARLSGSEKAAGKGGGKAEGKGTGKSEGKDAGKEAGKGDREAGVRFVFPELVLGPGEVVVVFNGHESATPGAVGDASKAAMGNERFGGARVLSLRNTSKFVGLSNTADSVSLVGPDGAVVETIAWGDGGKGTEGGVRVSAAGGSVAREFKDGAWPRGFVDHGSLGGGLGERLFSPGVVKAGEGKAGEEVGGKGK